MPQDDTTKTNRHQYFDHVLTEQGHGSLKQWVIDRRTEGASWRTMARQLSTITGEDVLDQTLWRWFADDNDVADARQRTP